MSDIKKILEASKKTLAEGQMILKKRNDFLVERLKPDLYWFEISIREGERGVDVSNELRTRGMRIREQLNALKKPNLVNHSPEQRREMARIAKQIKSLNRC